MTNKRLKVVHIPFSGRNPYQRLLSKHLVKKGLDVKGAKIDHLFNISFLNFSLLLLIFRHWKPDVIHLHWQSSFLYVSGSRLKSLVQSIIFVVQVIIIRILSIKLVWTVHNTKRHEAAYRNIEFLFTKVLARLADRVIVHCSNAGAEMQRQYSIKSNKIDMINHGHFLDCYPNNVVPAAARKKLNLNQKRLTFLFLGELRYYKGVLDLIDAFNVLNDDATHLVIAGRPHDKKIYNDVKSKIGESTRISTYLKYIPDNELQIYINACDVMVFPYKDVFTSGSIFLAMTFGKAIIAPRLVCLADTLYNTPNFLYDVSSRDGLLNAITKAVESKSRLHDIGQSNYELSKRYGWHDIADRTRHCYQKTLN